MCPRFSSGSWHSHHGHCDPSAYAGIRNDFCDAANWGSITRYIDPTWSTKVSTAAWARLCNEEPLSLHRYFTGSINATGLGLVQSILMGPLPYNLRTCNGPRWDLGDTILFGLCSSTTLVAGGGDRWCCAPYTVTSVHLSSGSTLSGGASEATHFCINCHDFVSWIRKSKVETTRFCKSVIQYECFTVPPAGTVVMRVCHTTAHPASGSCCAYYGCESVYMTYLIPGWIVSTNYIGCRWSETNQPITIHVMGRVRSSTFSTCCKMAQKQNLPSYFKIISTRELAPSEKFLA